MKQTKNRLLIQKLVYFLTMAVILAGDQITKIMARGYFDHEGQTVTAIPGLLDFTFLLNEGATAGILKDIPWVFMILSTVMIIAFLLFLAFSKEITPLVGFSLALILGGGIGNMIDRIAFGKVTDFLFVTAVDFFPFNCVFNVADVFICVGTAMLFLALICEEINSAKKKKAEAAKTEAEGSESGDTAHSAEKSQSEIDTDKNSAESEKGGEKAE